MKSHKPKRLTRLKLLLSFTIVSFIITTISMSAITTFFRFVSWADFLDFEMLPPHIGQAVLFVSSLFIGIILTVLFRRFIVSPLYAAYAALNRIAEGDYNVEIRPHGIKIVSRVARQINATAKELRSIEIMRNDFINNFSHEFKTPIISIEGFAKILRDKNLTEAEREEYLNIIISESHRLAELSTNILTLNKLENQALLTGQTSFNVTEQIRLCVVLLEKKWSEKNIDLDFTGSDYEIYGNEALLQQLWINIIDNSVKYSEPGGSIKICVRKEDRHLRFTFTDTGKGMTKEEKKHAFDRFYQADLDHKTGGNGIGLPVARKICELHEGEITLSSAPGEGTTVTVKLPC